MIRNTFDITIFLALSAAITAGCASNGVRFSERTTDPETGQVVETTFTQTARVTWGSTLEEGTGNMTYSGPDWSLGVGNNAKEAKAGNGVEALRLLISLGQLLAQPAQASAPQQDAGAAD